MARLKNTINKESNAQGKLIEKAIKKKGISNAQACRDLKLLNTTFFTYINRADRRLPMQRISEIAEYLEIPKRKLFDAWVKDTMADLNI